MPAQKMQREERETEKERESERMHTRGRGILSITSVLS